MTARLPEQKLILCGEYNVGKSSLFRRFINNEFVQSTSKSKASTIGLDFYSKIFSAKNYGVVVQEGQDSQMSQQQQQQQQQQFVKLQLWDTGGMERVASVTSSYYKFSEGALLVFSLNSTDSFNALSQHLIEVVSYAENAKIFICGNKTDLQAEITDEEIDEFCEQCGTLISGVYKTSCKTGSGIQSMFEDISRVLHESNKSRLELQSLNSVANSQGGFKLGGNLEDQGEEGGKSCTEGC